MNQDANNSNHPSRPDEPGDNQKPEPLISWFKRQVAYVKEALETDAHGNPLPKKEAASDSPVNPDAIYRKTHVEEQPLPQNPSLKLRRTVIDEVIPEKPASPDSSNQTPGPG